jgi:xanthine dehydrogenase accessory factor
MGEIADVLTAIGSLHQRGEQMALATVVAARGSTYRRPGARLLIPETGDLIGNISGGCVDGDVVEVAKVVMVGGKPRLASFDLTSDDEAVWGYGLGCNGAIEVFVEPADKAAEVAGALQAALDEERPLGVALVLESDVEGVERGSRMLVHPDGRTEGTLGSPLADDVARAQVLEALEAGKSATKKVLVGDGEIRAFFEVLEPSPRLLVCGAGHDAIPFVRIAAEMGWKVLVVDDREQFLNAERFPEAAGFVLVDRPLDAAERTGADKRTYVALMSHNYLRDLDYLKSYLGTDVAYIASLGPRPRLERLLADLAKEGIYPPQSDLDKIFGPAGVDIGGEGPEEVALAMVAEIMAVRHRRSAGFLRDRKGPIHERENPETAAAVTAG